MNRKAFLKTLGLGAATLPIAARSVGRVGATAPARGFTPAAFRQCGKSNLTMAKLRQAAKILDANDCPSDQRWVVVSQKQIDELWVEMSNDFCRRLKAACFGDREGIDVAMRDDLIETTPKMDHVLGFKIVKVEGLDRGFIIHAGGSIEV